MHDELRAEIRRLRRINAISITLLVVGSLAAFTQVATSRKATFDEIDVGRINVKEPDGTLRLTLSNKARLPEVVIGGKTYPLRGGTGVGSAGLIFFNDAGNENGGLVYQSGNAANGYRASAHLTFDQYNQDETVALLYQDVSGRRQAGLAVYDRSDVPIQVFAESAVAIMQLPEGAERTRRMTALRANAAAFGGSSATRLYAGKEADKSAIVSLADRDGKPRLRLSVDSLGAAKIEFLDAAGKVTSALPRAQ
ncbi:MAG: hypothetical protein M3081_21400 [Gemmatimonadota bacterium]|nr:hypothetical protein [Gemmatimonadota bacterium]